MFPSTPSALSSLLGAPGSLNKGMDALSLDAKMPGNGCRADTSVDDSEQQAVALERCSFCALLDRDGCGMCGCEFVERCVRERVVGVGFFGHFSPVVVFGVVRGCALFLLYRSDVSSLSMWSGDVNPPFTMVAWGRRWPPPRSLGFLGAVWFPAVDFVGEVDVVDVGYVVFDD